MVSSTMFRGWTSHSLSLSRPGQLTLTHTNSTRSLALSDRQSGRTKGLDSIQRDEGPKGIVIVVQPGPALLTGAKRNRRHREVNEWMGEWLNEWMDGEGELGGTVRGRFDSRLTTRMWGAESRDGASHVAD